jgi:protein TonB
VKDLLPSLTRATSTSATRTVIPLNTKDPTYVTYNGKIGQMIEINWQFPEVAKQYGFKGKVILEFTITAKGELAEVRLIRSSGYNLLDEEAMRAVKTAAPFPPFPPWIKDDRLVFSAGMEYLNSNATVPLTR